MSVLYWRIWRETKKRYRDLTTLFLVSTVGAPKSQVGLSNNNNNNHSNNRISKGKNSSTQIRGKQKAMNNYGKSVTNFVYILLLLLV